MAVTIHAPSSEFSGATGGIQFSRGVAVVDHLPVAVAAYMARHRYLIREDAPQAPIEGTVSPTPKVAPGRRGPARKESGQ